MKKKKISIQEQNRRAMQSLYSKGNVRYDENGNKILFHYDKTNRGYRVEHEN